MAQTVTLEGLRSQQVFSIVGRRLGFSLGNSSHTGEAKFLGGMNGIRVPITALTTASTAAEDVLAYGIVTFGTSTTGGTTFHSLRSPIPGAEVKLINLSTGYQAVWLNGGTDTTAVFGVAQGSEGVFMTTATSIKLTGKGAWANLVGLTTALWFVNAQVNTTVTTWGTSIT